MSRATILGLPLAAAVILGALAPTAPASRSARPSSSASGTLAAEMTESAELQALASSELAAEEAEEAAEAAVEAREALVDRATRKLPAYAHRIDQVKRRIAHIHENKLLLRPLPLKSRRRQRRLPVANAHMREVRAHMGWLRGEVKIKEKAWLLEHGYKLYG
jgi:hypothetical protein